MEVRKIVGREFTSEEQYTIENVGKYIWGTMAIIGEGCGILFPEADNESFSYEELMAKGHGYMEEIISHQPDFDSWDMNDGACLIIMGHGFAFSAPDMPVTLSTKLMTRGQLLDACERGEIIAFVEIENGKN